MNRFFVKLFIFSVFPLLTLYGVFLLENGTADPFYQRFTTPKQEALILGNSKAAQGIIPSIINKRLEGIYDGNLYNYSFTVYNSPFGPAYLESIKKKLADYNGERCFIVTVDPWSISSDVNDPNNQEKFDENFRFIADISNVTSKPNLKYLLKWFSKSYYEIILMRFKNNLSLLHDDGWFLTGDYTEEENAEMQRELMVKYYEDYLTRYSFSKSRLGYLEKTIEYLQTKGDVFLVRMPLHSNIYDVEYKLCPNFNELIYKLVIKYQTPYFNFTERPNNYGFKDGLHLIKESGILFSNDLGKEIRCFKTLRN